MKQSKKLTKFYRAYIDAVYNNENEKYTPDWFRDYSGLCDNLDNYLRYSKYENKHLIEEEMNKQFELAGLDTNYPFTYEKFKGDLSKDKNRIRWVKKHLSRNVKKKFKLR